MLKALKGFVLRLAQEGSSGRWKRIHPFHKPGYGRVLPSRGRGQEAGPHGVGAVLVAVNHRGTLEPSGGWGVRFSKIPPPGQRLEQLFSVMSL